MAIGFRRYLPCLHGRRRLLYRRGHVFGGVTFEEGKLYVDAETETVGDNAETETVGDNTTIITASEFTTPLCNVASCDFYYYYPISGTAGTDENPQDYAVIYGYWDVMKLARDDGGAATALKDSGLIYPYGAVLMVEGEGIVRGGTFSNHFDAVNTYGIYAEGGTLSVSKNTTVDTTFTTVARASASACRAQRRRTRPRAARSPYPAASSHPRSATRSRCRAAI